MTDPVRRFRDRPSAYLTAIFAAIMVIALVLVVRKVEHEQTARTKEASHEQEVRTKQLQDVICGVYVPIANASLPPSVSGFGKTISLATRHGAVAIHCPGLKR